MSKHAILALEDGTVFYGTAFGYQSSAVGEVIFNTSITGYQEIVTDPSYAKQIITLTHPQIGNVGANNIDIEASCAHASALIIKNRPHRISNWRSECSLSEFLDSKKVVGLCGIDTRQLTRIIRTKGALNGCVLVGEGREQEAVRQAQEFAGLKGMDLARLVSTEFSYEWRQGETKIFADQCEQNFNSRETFKVAAYDFGVKQNILRLLVDRGCSVSVVPAQTRYRELAEDIDGVFLSNGPGDPEPCDYAIEAIREMFDSEIPVFGICLGHQLMALAAGARTLKMKHGHHGANHPVRDLKSGRIMITSQNHGFAVDDHGLPEDLVVTHRSLFDDTIQGLEHVRLPAFSFQGHPEASPGPHDCIDLFDRFIQLMQQRRKSIEAA